jgi:hypothetical protein
MTIVYLRTQNRLTCIWSAMRGGAVPGRTKSAGRSHSEKPIALRDDRQSQASRDIRRSVGFSIVGALPQLSHITQESACCRAPE